MKPAAKLGVSLKIWLHSLPFCDFKLYFAGSKTTDCGNYQETPHGALSHRWGEDVAAEVLWRARAEKAETEKESHLLQGQEESPGENQELALACRSLYLEVMVKVLLFAN